MRIGRGIFRNITPRLSGPGIPRANAENFSHRLFRRTGCVLAWHKARRVFLVMRDRGNHRTPVFYAMDLGREHFPLGPGKLESVVDYVRMRDAAVRQDAETMLRLTRKMEKARWEKARDKFIDDRLPDARARLKRRIEILTDGRYRNRFFLPGPGRPIALARA